MRRILLSAAGFLLVACQPGKGTEASSPDALQSGNQSCKILTNDGNYEGPCLVAGDDEGMAVSFPGDEAVFGYLVSLSVFEDENGRFEVRGLTTDGINSRWGEAEKSADQPGCWIGSDFTICKLD